MRYGIYKKQELLFSGNKKIVLKVTYRSVGTPLFQT